jgi:hypothetical protein
MRNYHIDELTTDDIERLQKALDAKDLSGSMKGFYWLDLPRELYSELQTEHADSCGPYSFGIEVLEDGLRMELLARARNIIRCGCVTYATPDQRDYAINWLDGLLKEQDIPA